MLKAFTRGISFVLVWVLLVTGFVPRLYAGFSPSEGISSHQSADRSSQLERVRKVLEKKMVSDRLEKLGFSSSEIRERLEKLSDQQLHQLALNLDELRVGSGGFEFLAILLLIGIFVGVWLLVTGHKINIT